MNLLSKSDKEENRFESVIKLCEVGRKSSLVLNGFGRKWKVLGIHIYGNDKIKFWKRWGDDYERRMDIDCNKSKISMEVTPFDNSVAVI